MKAYEVTNSCLSSSSGFRRLHCDSGSLALGIFSCYARLLERALQDTSLLELHGNIFSRALASTFLCRRTRG